MSWNGTGELAFGYTLLRDCVFGPEVIKKINFVANEMGVDSDKYLCGTA